MSLDPALPELSAGAVAAAGRDLPQRFVVTLAHLADSPLPPGDAGRDQVRLECREVLRLLPGRRLVTRVTVAGRPAILKLFVGPGARRYWARERRGCRLLAAAGVATPGILAELRDPADGAAGAHRAHGLLLEYLAEARPVSPDDAGSVERAAGQLARLHAAGCRHGDLHLDNFLAVPGGGTVYFVDGDGVRRCWSGVPGRRACRNDLGVLCAQRPPLADDRLSGVYAAYARERGWPTGGEGFADSVARLAATTRAQRRRRLHRYLAKAQRECSEYVRRRSWRHYLLAVREAWDEALAGFVEDPEAVFRGGEILKAGNSATVARVYLGGRARIVKRYNLKGPWHTVRRVLKPVARFRLAWLNGQRLHMLAIPTARPLALLERRWGPLRGVAYLVMEDLGDLDLGSEVAARGLSETRLAQVVEIFRALQAAGLSHGDTKASNFLVGPAGVAVIDLDAMGEGVAGQARDRRRFLANFDDRPDVHRRVAAALPPSL